MKYESIIATPFGKIGIKVNGDKLTNIEFLSSRFAAKPGNKSPLLIQVKDQLNQYFSDPKFVFDLPIDLIGTPLQLKIWKALQKIPAGKVVTYKDLARKLHTHPRVVGNACRRNPIPLIIPCHRVVATNGLGGFCGNIKGPWLAIKKWLLAHECEN